jgi:hypothetical protein
MHDPMTLAFDIKYPWFVHRPWPKKSRRDPNPFELKHNWDHLTPDQQKKRNRHWPEGYRNTFLSIWHVDPEKDGTDDSCGWSRPKISKELREKLRNVAWSEGRNRHFLRCSEKEWNGSLGEAETLYRCLVFLVARVMRTKLSFDEVAKQASEAVHHLDCGKSGSMFCFLAGYHSNFKTDDDDHRQEHFHGILCNVARSILDSRRPWYRHPKWHFWHWKFQCHPLVAFKRWAFSRCCKCGKRFSWGHSPVTNNWNAKGPKWFRGERDVYHSNCNNPTDHCLADSASNKS